MNAPELNTEGARRRRRSSDEKRRIVEETLHDADSIAEVARRNDVVPNLLYRWRKQMLEEGTVVEPEDNGSTSTKAVRDMENHIRELERQLGRKTLEVEILKESLDSYRLKKRP